MANREDIKAIKAARRKAMLEEGYDFREKVDTRRQHDAHKDRRNWRKQVEWED